MKKLEEKIVREGQVLPGGVLKVGSFLNQRIDTVFLKEMAEETARLFEGAPGHQGVDGWRLRESRLRRPWLSN